MQFISSITSTSVLKTSFLQRKFLILLLFLALFISTRFLGILSFPIFNDESIYIQYSQLINENPERYWFISMDNIFKDFKPPLQYWLGSLFIDLFPNPLFAARFLSATFSIGGLIGIYFFVLNLYGRREAIWAALFFIFSPYVLMYNTQFTAETYIFSTAALLYLFSLRLVQSPFYKVRWGSFFGVIICGTVLLLFKQSGAMYLYLLVFLLFILLEIPFLLNKSRTLLAAEYSTQPLLVQDIQPNRSKLRGILKVQDKQQVGETKKNILKEEREEKEKYSIKKWQFIIAVLTIGAVTLSFFYYNAIIPLSLTIAERGFTSRWLMSLGEILTFPTDIWLSNAKIVFDIYRYSYGLAVIPLILGFIIFSFWRANIRDIVISLLFIISSMVIIFGLRSFNEYIYNTAVIIFLITILSRAASLLWEKLEFNSEKVAKAVKIFIAVSCLIIFSQWSYQLILMKTQPVKYFEKNSPWVIGNYLISWASGYGVNSVVNFLKEQEGPAITFVDPQWGNPGTSLMVFNKYYPQVKVVPVISDQSLNSIKKDPGFKNRFVIFSRSFREWESYIIANFCPQMREFKEYERQKPIIVCRF